MKKCNCGSCHTEAAAVAVAQAPCSCGGHHGETHSHENGSGDSPGDEEGPPGGRGGEGRGAHRQNTERNPGGHMQYTEGGVAVAEGPLTGCGCGHCHGEEGGGEITTLKQDIISVAAAVAVTVPTLLFAQGALRAALMVAAILIAGWPIFLQGLKNIARLDFEELTLMTIAVTAACIIGEFPEALLVTLLFRIGEMLEEVAVSRSRREVEAITRIIPDNANLLLAEGGTRTVPAGELAVGSRILLKSGERVPVDCVVLSGESSLDTSSLTGESVAREVRVGDMLLSGSVNLGGVLTCETTSTFDNSTAAKIVEMVKESAAKKGKTERLISKFARVYTPCVIAAAVLVTVVPPLLGLGSFTEWLSRALVFLVAACPCALVIATPLSFFAGIGAAGKQGILIKGSRYVEALAGAKGVVFDKTGTLTTGVLKVSKVATLPGSSREEVLELAGICEASSNHPIARAVAEAAGNPDPARAEKVEEITSYGMAAEVDGGRILCGSARLMEREGVDLSGLPEANVYLARDGKALGAIQVFDEPRPDAAATMAELEEMGVRRRVMLTGDSESSARKAAGLIGIDEVAAELLPGDKVTRFEDIQSTTPGKTLFVGDGVNDSPVLARSDGGVAMGMGSDAAIEAADVVLLSDRLKALPQAIRIARRTSRLARFNISFALAVKALVFLLALTGTGTMWMAVFADVGVTVLSVLNATRALRFH